MGIWDHFYPNSIFSPSISTYYVNLPHYLCFESKPNTRTDDQHSKFEWFKFERILSEEKFHPYVKEYANWLKKMERS